MNKAVVLVSGGLDSSTCLWWAKSQGWDLHALSFNYGGRRRREMRASEALVKVAGVIEHKTVALPFLKELEDMRVAVLPPALRGRTGVYIPARNSIFYSVAAWWAEILGARYIVGGHHPQDHSLFPDSTPEYFDALGKALKLGTFSGRTSELKIVLPLGRMKRSEVVLMAVRLGVPIHLTWSCYGEGKRACGRCDACRKRLAAFREAGVEDPLEYETRKTAR